MFCTEKGKGLFKTQIENVKEKTSMLIMILYLYLQVQSLPCPSPIGNHSGLAVHIKQGPAGGLLLPQVNSTKMAGRIWFGRCRARRKKEN